MRHHSISRISELYERTSMTVTTNPAFGDELTVFRDAKMIMAFLDCSTHRREIAKTGNEIWRFKNRA